jgi:adenylate kinase family enzyme
MLSHKDPLPHPPERVLVAGVSGAGKTTLAGRIATLTGGPHTEIDALFHGPEWTPRPEFSADVETLVRGDSWTTEWQYDAVRPLLAESADLLVWLDFPFARVTLPRLVRRTIRRRWSRKELWNGNFEAPLWTVLTDREHIVRWAIRSRRNYTAAVPGLAHEHPHLIVVRLRSQQEAEGLLFGPLAHAVGADAPDW